MTAEAMGGFLSGFAVGFIFCALLAWQFVRWMREKIAEFAKEFYDLKQELERVKALADSLWQRWIDGLQDKTIREIEQMNKPKDLH